MSKSNVSKEPLTDAEIDKIAAKIHGTTQNVYDVAERMFPGKEFREEDWARIEKIGRVFKCESCDEWKGVAQQDRQLVEMCELCASDLE